MLKKLCFIVLIVCAAVLLFTYDRLLFYAINNGTNTYAPEIISAYLSNLGDGVIAAGIAILLLQFRPKLALKFIVSVPALALLIQLCKYYFALPRPPAVLDSSSFTIIGAAFATKSFPSGHAATIFLLTGFIWLNYHEKLIKYTAIVIACLVAISRITVGVHWLSDIIFGAMLGLSVAYLVQKIFYREPTMMQSRVLIIVAAIILYKFALDKGSEFAFKVVYTNYIVCALCILAIIGQGYKLVIANTHLLRKYHNFYLERRHRLAIRFLGFGLVGSLGFVVDTVCYALGVYLGLQHSVARAISYWLAASNNWYLNRNFTYNDVEHGRMHAQWLQYLCMCAISFVVNWGSYVLLTTNITYFATHKYIAFLLGIILGISVNFTGAHKIIFKLKNV